MVTPFSVEWCPEISNKIILPILIIFSQGSEMILTNMFVLILNTILPALIH